MERKKKTNREKRERERKIDRERVGEIIEIDL